MTEQVLVSIVCFNGRLFLQRCLEAVFAQTYRPIEVYLLDNASGDGSAEFVAQNFPAVKIIRSSVNLGFAVGHNRIIHCTESAYVLALNQDAFLCPIYLETLVKAMKDHAAVGIAGGKLYSLRTDTMTAGGEQIIDMTWLDIEKKRRQVCYAQWQPDRGQTDSPTFAFAMDGAAMLLRRSMLNDLELEHQFFDEDFFAGKEDLDISWRAQLLGWRCLFVPSATGYHLRTFTPRDRRSEISEALKIASIRNRYLLITKNDLLSHFLRHLPYIILHDIKIMGYVLLYERSSLKGYWQFLQLLPKMLRKRRVIMSRKRVNSRYILDWFR